MARRPDRPATLLKVTRSGYEPSSPYDAELHAHFALGSFVEGVLAAPRSPKQLRLYWWALGKVAENQERFATSRDLSNTLLMELGYVEAITLLGGGLHIHPRPISDMDGHEFNAFFDQAMGVISEEVIPGLDIPPLLKHGRIQIGGGL